MRSAEINNDLLEILNKSDARKSLGALRRATALSRSNVTKLRSNHIFSIEGLTQNLEDVARGSLSIEYSLQGLKNVNKNDVRIRFLTELVTALDIEKIELSKRLNKALADYSRIDNDINASSSTLTKRRALAPINESIISTNKSTFGGANEVEPSIKFKPISFNAPVTINTPRSRTRSYIQKNGSSSNNSNRNINSRNNTGNSAPNVPPTKLPESFLRQSLLLDRDSFRQNREFLQQQTRFQADSQRRIESRLDTIADLLRRANLGAGGGGSSGFDIPDIDLGDGRKRRGRRAGRARSGGKLGRFGKGLGGSLAGGLLSELIGLPDEGGNTGLGGAAGGLLGSLFGIPGSVAGSFVGNEIEKYLDGVAKGKISGLAIGNKDDVASKKRLTEALDKIKNKDAIGDLPGVDQEAERETPANSARQRFKELQSNTNTSSFTPTIEVTRDNSNDRGMPVNGFRDAFFNVQPEGTVIIKTERLLLNGGISGADACCGCGGDAMNSTNSNFGGMGMGSGGFGGGGGGNPGIVGGNTPALIPNVKPGLGQTPLQAQADARQYLEQSKMPQYNPEMSPNAAAGGGPMQMPDGTAGGEAPKSVTDLPMLPGTGAAGSSALKNSNGTTISTYDTNMPAHQRALLDTISRYESNGKGQGYNTTVGGGTFEGNQHPGSFGGASTAAGRYQFLKGTWDDTVKNYNKEHPDDPITDFSPRNQDRAAYYLAQQDYKRRTGRDLDADLQNGDYSHIKEGLGGSGLNTTWQGFQGKEGIPGVMEDNLKRNKQYAESSVIKDLDPNAVPNAGVGSTPRGAIGDILGEATPGDPNKAMFGTVQPETNKPNAGNYDAKDPRQFKTTDVIGADHPIWGMVDPKLAAFKDSILGKTGSGAATNNITAGAILGADAVFRRAASEGVDMKVATGGGSNQHSRNHGAGTGVGEAIDIKPSAGWSSPDQAKSYAETAAAAGANRLGVPANGSGLHVQDSRGTASGMPTMSWNYGRDTDMEFRKNLQEGKFNTPERKAEIDKLYPARIDPNAANTPVTPAMGPTMPEGPSIKGTIEGANKSATEVTKPNSNNQSIDDYSRNEVGRRNFSLGSDGYMPQVLGKNGFSSVDPKGAFVLPDGTIAYNSSADVPKNNANSTTFNGIANEAKVITQDELDKMNSEIMGGSNTNSVNTLLDTLGNKRAGDGTLTKSFDNLRRDPNLIDNLMASSQTLGNPSSRYSYEDPITGEQRFISNDDANRVDSEEKRQAAYDAYVKQGELQPGETFSSWIERRKALGFEESDLRNKSGLGYGEGETQPIQSYTGNQYGGNQGSINDGGTSKEDLEDYLNNKYAKSQDPNSFEGRYGKQLDDGYKGSEEQRLNRQKYGRNSDEFYAQNPLSIAEIKALYGPNATTDGVSPSMSPDSANAMSQGSSEGSTRQSVAPPVKETPASDSGGDFSKKDSDRASSDKETPSAASVTPVGGGDQEELSKIPTHHDDLGLNALNDKDLNV